MFLLLCESAASAKRRTIFLFRTRNGPDRLADEDPVSVAQDLRKTVRWQHAQAYVASGTAPRPRFRNGSGRNMPALPLKSKEFLEVPAGWLEKTARRKYPHGWF
jgi:hypothetical protein